MKDFNILARECGAPLSVDSRETLTVWLREYFSCSPSGHSILGESKKTVLSAEHGFLVRIAYLSPASDSGWNTCPWSTETCRNHCLKTAGRMQYVSGRESRARKTALYFLDRPAFWGRVFYDTLALVRLSEKKGLRPAVRLNGTSDLPFHRDPMFLALCRALPAVRFFDYTKDHSRLHEPRPANYHITFSLSDAIDSDYHAKRYLERGGNVAAVVDFRRSRFMGFPTVDGDAHDCRFADPCGSVAVLSPKGSLRRVTPTSCGFVRLSTDWV